MKIRILVMMFLLGLNGTVAKAAVLENSAYFHVAGGWMPLCN